MQRPRAAWRTSAVALAGWVGLALAVSGTGPADAAESPENAAGRPRTLNGFVLSPIAIPVEEVLPGGPPRDGIPALDDPKAIAASEAQWSEDELVIGVALEGAARAYPVPLLEWHELVNDTLGGRPILVSYCPLCGTGIVFDRQLDGKPQTFGVSGLLYRSDLLLYDRTTNSLWSQIPALAVAGPRTGTRLSILRSEMTRWGDWRRRHPDTTTLSADTGHRRPYGKSPYGDYAQSEKLHFPAPVDGRYHPKMPTLGIRVPGGAARAYPAVEVVRAGGTIREVFEGRRVSVSYDPDNQVFRGDAPEDLEIVEGYWFAWAAFHPKTTVFTDASGKAASKETDPVRHPRTPEEERSP